MININGRCPHQERLTLDMSAKDMFVALSEGNPGGLRVMMDMFQRSPDVDPESAFGGYAPLIHLDSFGIYGSRIWLLYKDVCGEDVAKTIAMLRAVQMGVLSNTELHLAIDGLKRIHVDDVMRRLKEVLPSLNLQLVGQDTPDCR